MIYPINSNSSRIQNSLSNSVIEDIIVDLVKVLEQKSLDNSTVLKTLTTKLVSKDAEIWRRLLDDSSKVLVEYFYSKHDQFFNLLSEISAGQFNDDKVKNALTLANNFSIEIKKFKNVAVGQVESLSKLLA